MHFPGFISTFLLASNFCIEYFMLLNPISQAWAEISEILS